MKAIAQPSRPSPYRPLADEPGRTDRRFVGAHHGRLRAMFLTLIVAAFASACGDIVIGPVDHSCPTQPSKQTDSGCAYRG